MVEEGDVRPKKSNSTTLLRHSSVVTEDSGFGSCNGGEVRVPRGIERKRR